MDDQVSTRELNLRSDVRLGQQNRQRRLARTRTEEDRRGGEGDEVWSRVERDSENKWCRGSIQLQLMDQDEWQSTSGRGAQAWP